VVAALSGRIHRAGWRRPSNLACADVWQDVFRNARSGRARDSGRCIRDLRRRSRRDSRRGRTRGSRRKAARNNQVDSDPIRKRAASGFTMTTPAVGSVTVVLMAYNEAGSLERVANEIHGALQRLSGDHELLIVDDGSRDGSGDIADKSSWS